MDIRDRLEGNLLEPLTFEDGEIDVFIRDHVCAFCKLTLHARHAKNRKSVAFCLTHGDVMAHNYIAKYTAEQAVQGERAGMLELRQPLKPRAAEEILKELGFS